MTLATSQARLKHRAWVPWRRPTRLSIGCRLRRIGPITEWSTWVYWVAFQLWHGHKQLQPCRWVFDDQHHRRTRSCVLRWHQDDQSWIAGWPATDRNESVALGVNNIGPVVGYAYLPAVGDMPLQQVAFLWRPGLNGSGQMINLNSYSMEMGKLPARLCDSNQ